jgi:dipeptidyl aminopeptidase/acylaminoacyl peptidase
VDRQPRPVCIQVNYRGSRGYGKAFLNRGDRQWGAKMHDDLLDVLGFAIAHGWVDYTRVAIYGASFGGYASLVGATFTPDTFAAAISVAGFANTKTLIEAIPPYWVPMRAQAVARIGDPDTEPDFLWSRSPLSRVDQITTPLMIVQGATDPRVPQAESDQIVAALNANNVPYEYLLFPDEGHGLVKPVNRLRFYAEAEAFLAKHLGGAAELQATTTTDTDTDPAPASPAGEEGHSLS